MAGGLTIGCRSIDSVVSRQAERRGGAKPQRGSTVTTHRCLAAACRRRKDTAKVTENEIENRDFSDAYWINIVSSGFDPVSIE